MESLGELCKLLVLSNLFFWQNKGLGIVIPEKGALYTNDKAANDQPQATGMCTRGVLAQKEQCNIFDKPSDNCCNTAWLMNEALESKARMQHDRSFK